MDSKCYAIVRNIPPFLHSKDLRKYFSSFTETGRFDCFHFRHRPERKQESENSPSTSTSNSKSKLKEIKTFCCVVRFQNSELRSEFIREFHGRHWTSTQGMEIPNRCAVNAIKVVKLLEAATSDSLTEADIRQLIELRPPIQMPQGNVGTPSQHFLEQIRLCKLPPSVIAKLGIQTGRRRRKFEAVPFQYGNFGGEDYDEEEDPEAEQATSSSTAQTLKQKARIIEKDPLDPTFKIADQQNPPDNDEGADSDNDQCEEWERHEAIHGDEAEKELTKERHYEKELEIVWEKGGPGLVWHTDLNYWDEIEKGTDCDWNWADDWDVDYSVYYEGKAAGELDARQAVEIREDEKMRSGKLEKSVFTRKIGNEQKRGRKRRHSGSAVDDMEKFTKGIGSKLLSKMGWQSGKGLGVREQGRVRPVAVDLEEDGQTPTDKKGFGYRGEKLQRTGFVKKPQRHLIASVFDSTNDASFKSGKLLDATNETLLRSDDPETMKYR